MRCQEFAAAEYEYMFVPTGELPDLIVTLPTGTIPLSMSTGEFPRFTSSANPWAVCHRAKMNILSCDPLVRQLPWALLLCRLTSQWSLLPPAAFLQEPRGDSENDEDEDSEFNSSSLSTPNEDAAAASGIDHKAKYENFQSWMSGCAAASNCERDMSANETGDEDKFLHTAQQEPAWFSDSAKGRVIRGWGIGCA